MKPDQQSEVRTVAERDLDKLLRDVDDEGRLVLSARRLPGGKVQLFIGLMPRKRRRRAKGGTPTVEKPTPSGTSTSDHCFSESQKS